MATMQHHPEGPSMQPMLAECPCFQSDKDVNDLEASESETDENSNAARGTACHAALGLRIRGVDGWDAGLSSRERANVEWCAVRIIEIASGFGYGPADIEIEVRVSVQGSDLSELHWGTLDVRFGPVVLDAKFGLRRNYFPQVASYTLGTMQERRETRRFGGVVYGHLRTHELYPVSRKAAETVVWGIAARRASPHRKPCPCQYCGWCSASATCSAFVAPVDALAVIPQWRGLIESAKSAPVDVRLGLLKHLEKAYLEPFAKRVAQEVFLYPDVVPLGFSKSMVAGRGRITNQAAAVAALKGAGVTDTDLAAVATYSFSTLLDAYRRHYPEASEEATRRSVLELLGDLYTPGEPTPRLTQKKEAASLILSALNPIQA